MAKGVPSGAPFVALANARHALALDGERRDEFLCWVDTVSAHTRFANPPEIIRWNTRKRYLAALAARRRRHPRRMDRHRREARGLGSSTSPASTAWVRRATS